MNLKKIEAFLREEFKDVSKYDLLEVHTIINEIYREKIKEEIK